LLPTIQTKLNSNGVDEEKRRDGALRDKLLENLMRNKLGSKR